MSREIGRINALEQIYVEINVSRQNNQTNIEKKVVFYGQEPPSGESTTTECGINYQLLAVITEVAQWGTLSGSRPQFQLRTMASDCRSN